MPILDVALSYLQRPEHVLSLADLSTGEEVEMQFNPAEMNMGIAVTWARLHPVGLSHERLQYDHTENSKFTFQLVFDELIFRSDTRSASKGLAALDVQNFLLSLCYSKRGAATVNDGEIKRTLFVWPNFIALTAVITSLKFKWSRFNLLGQPTFFTVDVAIEEIRDERLFSEDVRKSGLQRSSKKSEGV